MSDSLFAAAIIAVTVMGAVVAIRLLWLMLTFEDRKRGRS